MSLVLSSAEGLTGINTRFLSSQGLHPCEDEFQAYPRILRRAGPRPALDKESASGRPPPPPHHTAGYVFTPSPARELAQSTPHPWALPPSPHPPAS